MERHGIVFVTQHGSANPEPEMDELAGLITPDLRFVGSTSNEQPVNWKLRAETFLEGYHIRFLHQSTFFPLQFDNLNVIEAFGRNSRITFPYRNIARPFDAGSPAAVRGRLTYVYHLFPNVMVATFPDQIVMVVLTRPPSTVPRSPPMLGATTRVIFALRPSSSTKVRPRTSRRLARFRTVSPGEPTNRCGSDDSKEPAIGRKDPPQAELPKPIRFRLPGKDPHPMRSIQVSVVRIRSQVSAFHRQPERAPHDNAQAQRTQCRFEPRTLW